jgi:hypothetical protein
MLNLPFHKCRCNANQDGVGKMVYDGFRRRLIDVHMSSIFVVVYDSMGLVSVNQK